MDPNAHANVKSDSDTRGIPAPAPVPVPTPPADVGAVPDDYDAQCVSPRLNRQTDLPPVPAQRGDELAVPDDYDQCAQATTPGAAGAGPQGQVQGPTQAPDVLGGGIGTAPVVETAKAAPAAPTAPAPQAGLAPPPHAGVAALVPELGGDAAFARAAAAHDRRGSTPLSRAARGTTPLAHQVAGHAGVMSDESGSLVIKPTQPREIAFYQLVAGAPRSAPISALRPFLPKFYGTLTLEGQDDGAGGIAPVAGADDAPECIVIENLTHAFTHPSVLDAKLGTKLHAPDATPEKAARMEKKAAETTTGKVGLRLTGAKTWHAPTATAIDTPRGFGYNASVDDLPEGLRRVFPLPTDVLPFMSDDGATGPEYTGHTLPPRLAARVLSLLDGELERLLTTLGRIELRAVGASLLIVYEGDAQRLAAALERHEAKRVSLAAKSLASPSAQPIRVTDGDPECDGGDEASSVGDDESDTTDDTEGDDDTDDDDDDDGVAADERRARKCPPLVVRLIDFAHTWLAQGEGPDEGVLLGIRTLRGLVQGRLREVEAYIAKHEGGVGAGAAGIGSAQVPAMSGADAAAASPAAEASPPPAPAI